MQTRIPDDLIDNETLLLGGITDRQLGALRLFLASAALLIISIDPTEPGRFIGLTYIAVIAFTLYSLFLCLVARQHTNFPSSIVTRLVWIDVAWSTALIGLSSGASSAFYFFYLFEIIVACSRRGKRLGLAVTIASAILCIGVGLLAPSADGFELNRFLLRPLAIIVLGYTLAFWGGAELTLKKKLVLLKELSTVANPRFGADRTIDQMLGRLLNFYNADQCMLLLGTDAQLYRAASPKLLSTAFSEDTDEIVRNFLVEESDSCPSVFSWPDSPGAHRALFRQYDPHSNKVVTLNPAPAESLARLLGAHSLIAVTCPYRENLRGRLLVSSSRVNAFDIADAAFLLQAANQILPLIENIRLVDRLASDASEAERQRIARSVHDRVIQPYYGLQIGLKALQELMESEEQSRNGAVTYTRNSGKPAMLLDRLMTMTNEGINELRDYVYGLKQTPANATRLADSIRRFARKFEGATGIRVNMEVGREAIAANDHLTAEFFQMTTEALSNIHRHTQAQSAQVRLNLQNNQLILQVENVTDPDVGPVPFSPSSISERASALGGSAEIFWQEGLTILKVEVPL